MKLPVLTTLQGYKKENLPKDLLSGVVIAAVSIPISMGYAQIAGLPAVYGLYGSVLPVLLFALFSTSPQFIFGVDAAPAAMVGAVLSSLGVALGSGEAVALVPVLTFYTALWLLLFAALRAGKVLNFISTPVMGGFISGICCTIILMQTPKLLGGTAGTGELPELTRHLIAACGEIHWLSLALGLAALGILLAGKRLFPKFPMAIAIMALGAVRSTCPRAGLRRSLRWSRGCRRSACRICACSPLCRHSARRSRSRLSSWPRRFSPRTASPCAETIRCAITGRFSPFHSATLPHALSAAAR